MSDAMAIGAMRALRDLRPDDPRRRQRRRLRRHRPRPARGPTADDGPPAHPAQGRGGGPPAPDRRPATRRGEARASPARDAAHRPRLDRPGCPADACDASTRPAWVRDAIFYQIFPDRFAASERVHKPGPLEPWDAPPTATGSRAATCAGIAERLDYLEDLGVNAHLPHADLQLGLEPPLPHVRLLRGRSAARRRRRAARAARRRPRARHAGRARRRVQPHRPRVLAVPPRPGDRRRVAVPATGSTSTTSGSTRGRPLLAVPAARRRRRRDLGYKAWWGLPALPKLNTDEPRGPRVPVRRRRALAPLRDRRLAARRAGRDRRRGVLAGVPAPLPGDPPGCLPRRRDLAGRARLAARRPVRRADELPAGRGDPRVRRRAPASTWRRRARHHEYRRSVRAARRPGVRGAAHGARCAPTTRTSSRSSSTCSARTTRRGCGPCSAATSRASGWRRCSR